VKRMCIVEEEVSLLQPETATVALEEEEVPVPRGQSVMVTPEEEVPPKEEEFPAHTFTVLSEEEEVPASPLVVVPPEGRGCLVPVLTMVSSSPFFFLKNAGDCSRPFFS
jgi:hypothetical protein